MGGGGAVRYRGTVALDLPDGTRLNHRHYKVSIFHQFDGAVEKLAGEAPVEADGSFRTWAFRIEKRPNVLLRARLIKFSNDQVMAETVITRPNEHGSKARAYRGHWTLPAKITGTQTFELVHKATGEVVDTVAENSNLLVSYRVPYSDGLHRYLSNRTYTYDQAVASIVAANSLGEATATR